MRVIVFRSRLMITATGAGLGLLGIFLALTSDGRILLSPQGIAIDVSVASAAALGGAAVTRRVVTAIIAAVLAALAMPATLVLLVYAACSSGACS
jgi:hypothetical protein